jgi:chloramphenicol-sensitive protein RarD
MSSSPNPPSAPSAARHGAIAAIAAYFIWGVAPLYFKAIHSVAAAEIIAHRVLWSAVLLAGVLLVLRQRAGIDLLRRQPRLILWLGLCTLLVTSNWLVYVWAVNAGRVLEASLGYFINPLVSVLLASLLLHERLRRAQWLAFGLAALGVVNQIVHVGALPWISLFLAVTFAIYGFLRKRLAIDAISGLFVETLLAAPLALLYLGHLAAAGQLAFLHQGNLTDLLLLSAGAVTSLPLVLFAYGARRLRLSTLGFLQYLAPSLMFLLGVTVFGEALDAGRLLTFVLIWMGLAVYSADVWRAARA